MSGRILPEYETVEVPDLMEAIYQALGAASVSWKPMDCTGVFQSETCDKIGDELFGVVQQWADGRDSAPRVREVGGQLPSKVAMRRFRVYRPNPPEGYREQGVANAPEEIQFEGVEFSDGTVCVRWLTEYRSHSIWASMDDLLKIHGHPEYGTKLVWMD